MSWNYDELSPSLRNQMKHHEPIVVVKEDEDTDREEVFRMARR